MLTEFTFPKEFTARLGLQSKTVHDLKPLVVLAGPNGAGKSRYLRIVEIVLNQAAHLMDVAASLRQEIKSGSEGLHLSVMGTPQERLEATRKELEALRLPPGLLRSNRGPRAIPLRYSLQSGYGSSPWDMTPSTVAQVVGANKKGGFDQAIRSVYPYFYEVAKALHEAENRRIASHPVLQKNLEDARSFNQILRALLSAEIEPDLNDDAQVVALFRGRPFNPAELSQGELILAVWAIILHRQKEDLRGAHLLIDEPETHLHPDVCIRALTALQEQILGPEGQIWLATHSVPLIAHAGIESVHFVADNSIQYGGNKIDEVLDRLLGGPEGRSKLRALMANADELAFAVFAAQSLLPPGVVSAREGDEQQAQMVNAARELCAGKENVRILDFAAGRGRLAAALKSAGAVANQRFTYYAFQDPNFDDPRDRNECLEHIRSLGQPKAPEAYLVDTLEGFTIRDAERMKLVVLCNVLHEIPVRDWQHSFERIHDVLEEDGYLVILEDQHPSVGELPHANGYVILNEPALQHLFDSKDAVRRVSVEKNGRLTAFAVPRPFLKRVTPQTIGRALASVKRMAEDTIRYIRGKPRAERSFQEGRLHAHFTLLYANAQLASHQFPDPDKRADTLQEG
ncbi:MAG: ATP-binding protein [Myxococcaceae bacterium]|nr:ATP-binding protein [Myxococcaceae bacterium]